MIWHLIPAGDLREHEESMTCYCAPVCKSVGNGHQLIVHDDLSNRTDMQEVFKFFKNCEETTD